jgi:hypothetical protein
MPEWQALSADKSCSQVVNQVLAWLISQEGAIAVSSDTSGYTQARQRLPEAGIEQVMQQSGQALEAELSEARLWHGHRVKLLDGSMLQPKVRMPSSAYIPVANLTSSVANGWGRLMFWCSGASRHLARTP